MNDPGSAEALIRLPEMGDPDDRLDVLLDGWEEDYLEGRAHLLARLSGVRDRLDGDARQRLARVIYRTLIGFGEESWDMRFVHLAVECRDTLIYAPVR